jgi:hypothetical protein
VEQPEDLTTASFYDEYLRFTIPELRAQLQKRKLTSVGDKEILAKRLRHDDETKSAEAVEAPQEQILVVLTSQEVEKTAVGMKLSPLVSAKPPTSFGRAVEKGASRSLVDIVDENPSQAMLISSPILSPDPGTRVLPGKQRGHSGKECCSDWSLG